MTASSLRWVKFFKKLFQSAFILVLLFFLFRYISRDWDKIVEALRHGSPVYFILGQVCFFMGTVTVALCWKAVLEMLGAPVGYFSAFKSFFWSNIYKYVPGKIWGATFRVLIAGEEGVPQGTAALGVILETVFLIVSSGIVGGLALTQWKGELPGWVNILPLLLAGSLALLHPRVLARIIPILSRRFPSYIIVPSQSPGFGTLLKIGWLYCGIWVWWGAGFFFALKALVPVSVDDFVAVMGSNTIAWLTGFVAVFCPAGLGIREMVLTYLTSAGAFPGIAALAAVIARVLTLIGELSAAGIVFVVGKHRKRLDHGPREC